MRMRVIGRIYFDPDDDANGAARALARAGFTITSRALSLGSDSRYDWIVIYAATMDFDSGATALGQPTETDGKVLASVAGEIDGIVRPFGGGLYCDDIGMFAVDDARRPAHELFVLASRRHC
jgi:hypothetical protein